MWRGEKLDLKRRRLGKFVFGIAVIWCVDSVVFFTCRTPLLQLLSFPLFLCFVGGVVAGFVCLVSGWRQRRWHSTIPLLACLIAFFLSGMLLRTARHFVFLWALPSYEAVVRQMESGKISVSAGFDNVPQAEAEARFVYRVYAEKTSNGVLMVEFDTESGFSVKHSGYFYSSSGMIERGSQMDSRWPIREEVRSRWFYASD